MKYFTPPRPISFSFELFPPKDASTLPGFVETTQRLSALSPKFISITSGAFSSDRNRTPSAIETLCQNGVSDLTAHVPYAGMASEEIINLLVKYKSLGINHIVALRGDAGNPRVDGFSDIFEFIEMVKFMGFKASVAAYPDTHPKANSPQEDIEHLIKKFDVGADNAITQFFFSAENFLRFRDKLPSHLAENLFPGLLPLTNLTGAIRMAKECNTEVPGWLSQAERYMEEEDRALYALAQISHMVDRLSEEGVKHFHIYSLNQTKLSFDLMKIIAPETQLDSQKI